MDWIRRLLWATGALLLLWAAAWLAVPPLLKWQGEKRLTELLGREATIGSIDFQPWALRLELRDLAIAAAAGGPANEAQFRLDGLLIDVDARSLLRLAPVVEALRLERPRLRVARLAEGRYDVDDILLRLQPDRDAPPGEPPRFALYNLELHAGEILFDDLPARRQHKLGALEIALPFLSNLPSQVEVKVEPRISFTLDGARYDSGGHALPFAQQRSGRLTLAVAGLRIEHYAGYLPEALPLRPQRGEFGAQLELDFTLTAQGDASVSLRGRLAAADLALSEAGGGPLLEAASMALELQDVQPLARKLDFGALRVDGLTLHVDRDAHGVLNLQRLQGGGAASGAASAADGASSAASAPAGASSPSWEIRLAALEIGGSRVLWNDAAVKPSSAWVFDELTLSAQQLQWPAAAAAPFSLALTLRPQSEPQGILARLAIKGHATDRAASAGIDLSEVSLSALAPYVNAAAHLRVAGSGAARGELEWAAASESAAQRVQARFDEVTLDRLEIDDPSAGNGRRGEVLKLERLRLSELTADLGRQSVAIKSARLQRPQLRLARSAQGGWNLAALAGPEKLAESERALARAAAQASWKLRLDELAIADGGVRFSDAAPAPTPNGAAAASVELSIDKLRVALTGLELDGERLLSRPGTQLSARVADAGTVGRDDPAGLVEWNGTLGLQPLAVDGRARVEGFPVHAVQAYLAHDRHLRLRRAWAGFSGPVTLRADSAGAIRLDASGDVLVSDLRLDATGAQRGPEGDELLSWQAFALNGFSVSLRPGSVPRVAVREATLGDFFARLVLTEEGRLNLRDATRATDSMPAAPAASAAAAGPAASAPLPLEFELGGLRVAGGRLDYSDRFVQPNFSAAITELGGTLGAFRLGSGDPATLQLSGKVAGTGLLEIGGRLKPGAVPRELDIKAKATDLELAPLSVYSGKYAGYAIERGKMSVEVHYTIERDGRLEATHQLVLNQLTFGDRVESASATKLPVRLAVSLLKDSHGVIDINLPVSGTLADPQFSLGPLIWKAIVNLLTKAVTAPFTLLAGGGPDLSVVAFVPGTNVPTDAGSAALDKVAKALADRPALKMTVVGQADLDAEREAYRRAQVEQRLFQEQRREELRSPAAAASAASAPEAAALPLSDTERARLLKEVYRQTDLPDKPRNMLGLKADIAPAEMEALLRLQVDAGPEAMRELALQRGLTVRETLASKGLGSERIFLGDPKLHTAVAGEGAWTPHAKLSLDVK